MQSQLPTIDSIQQLSQLINHKKFIILIVVDPLILSPSSSLMKFFCLNQLAQELKQYIYLFMNTSEQFYEQYKIYNFPTTLLLTTGGIVLSKFIGCDQTKSLQTILLLTHHLGLGDKLENKTKFMYQVCPQKHPFEYVTRLENHYYDNCFQCNICKMLSHADDDKPILHCPQCNYDVCFKCSQDEVLVQKQ